MLAPDALDETVRRRVDVEEAGPSGAWVAETVAKAREGGDERAGPDADGLVPDRELELALDDEERVDLVRMDVRVDGAELRIAGELDHLELVELGLDHEVTVLPGDSLALAGENDDRLREGLAAVGWRRVLVEAIRLLVAAVASGTQHVREACVGRVDVEEGRLFGALVGERVNDAGGCRDERSRRAAHDVRLIGPESERDLSAQHVEGVGVGLVDVALRAVLVGRIAEPRERKRFVVDEEEQRLLRQVGDRLALTRS